MLRGVPGALALGMMCWMSPAAADEPLPSPLRAGDLPALLARRNPEWRARSEQARAQAARPRQVQLEDPSVSLEWWQQPITFATVPLMLTLRQPLPWPGKLASRRRVAAREAESARDRVGETARRLEAEAKNALFDLALAVRSLEINARERTLLEAMVQSVEAKYRVGKAPQAAILRTQDELLTVDNQRLDLERARDDAQARLNALLDRPAQAPLPEVALSEPMALPPERELVDRALQHRPEVRLADDAVREAQARLDVARRETHPELAVWAAYQVNVNGVDNFTVGVSSTIPSFSVRRRSAAVDAAEAELAAARASLEAARRRAESEVRTTLLQAETALRHQKLHSDKLIPLAELSLQSAQAAYQNDRIDFFSVLDAARMVRDHHLNHERYLVEYEKRLAELERIVGEDLVDRGGR